MFSSSFTGIGRYTFELVENLQRISPMHEYVLFFNEPEFSSYTPKAPNFKKVLVNAKHYSVKEQTAFLKILNKENLDLMHFTHFNAPIRYRKPFIVTIHDLTHTLFPGRKMTSFPYRFAYKMVIKNAVRRARRIIAVSKNTKEDLIKILKVDPSKIDVIYEGVNDEFRQLNDEGKKEAEKSLAKKYGISKPFLLYTGVHRYHKNLPRLIEAFNILTASSHKDLSLIITGKKDPLYPEAEKLVKTFALENKVIFTGLIPEEDIIALYNLASVYVFPSLYEGFGLPLLEAFACGTPVAASNVSSIPEIAGHDKTGSSNALLFDPYSPQDIAKKIEQILDVPTLQQKLITNGLKRVKEFSWEKMAEEILNLYNRPSSQSQERS
jgi:glycosyltransferase involved in cell wall biosynthesis